MPARKPNRRAPKPQEAAEIQAAPPAPAAHVEPEPPVRAGRTYVVSDASEGIRLDRFLADRRKDWSRRRLMEIVKAGHIFVDGRRAKPGATLKAGAHVEVPPLTDDLGSARVTDDAPAVAARTEVTVIHRDDVLLVVSKPPGVPCHGGAGLGVRKTLLELLREDVLAGFGLAHRIDQDTSGLVALVRGAEARTTLSEAFATDGVIEKTYDAIVEGVPEPASGTIDVALAPPGHGGTGRVDRNGKPSRTDYVVVESFGIAARVRAVPFTGRTHQIRLHLAFLGTPLLVDPLYGKRGGWRLVDPKGGPAARLSRTPLHAAMLTLPHPVTGVRMTFHAPLLADHRRALEVLRVVGAREARKGGPSAPSSVPQASSGPLASGPPASGSAPDPSPASGA